MTLAAIFSLITSYGKERVIIADLPPPDNGVAMQNALKRLLIRYYSDIHW